MRKLTPEERERIRRHGEQNREARRKLQEALDRVEARMRARREEMLNRPRGLRRLLFWTR
jgi:hypothetical protein